MKKCSKCEMEFEVIPEDSVYVNCPNCKYPIGKINFANLKKAIEQKKNIIENNLIVNK